MGVSFGGGSSQSQTSGTASTQKTFSPGQSALQDQLGGSLAGDLAASTRGGLSPGVQAMATKSADDINTNSAGLTSRITQFLSSRGLGKSGQTGKVALQGELGREGQLGANQANFAQVQQNSNATSLLAALNYALTGLGTTGSTTGTASGSGFNWGAEASVSGAAPGPGGSVIGFGA